VNVFRILVCSAALSAAAIVPARAELKNLGTVYLDRAGAPVQFRDAFAAPVEQIAFKAVHGDVSCDSIRATFANGRTEDLYRGTLSHGANPRSMPPDAGAIQRIDFSCQSTSQMAGIEVMVELGRHEAAWRSHADWNGKWWYRIDPQGTGTGAPAS
jgi:hypothetical protein